MRGKGCGFLGHNTIIDLVKNTKAANADEVHVLDLKIDEDRPFHCRQITKANYHQGDIRDAARLEEVLQQVKPNVILDLVSPPMFLFTLAYYMNINVTARAKLLDIARQNGTKAFVYNSTAGVVHDSYSDLVNADESYPVLYMPQQREPYSHSKAVAESMVLQANGRTDSSKPKMLTAAVRLCSPFGDNHAETTNAIVENAREGKTRFQIGDGKNLTDWTYIENGVRGYLLVAQALLTAFDAHVPASEDERIDGEAFFITNNEPTPFWEFSRGLGAAAGFPTKREDVRVIPRPVGMIMAFIAEWMTWIRSFGRKKSAFTRFGVRYSTITRYHRIDKAKKRLKYEPFISLEEGMKRATASWRNEKASL